jgi:hypothetical protein
MSPVVITTILGLLTLAFGCIGLVDPRMVMGFVGFDASSPSYSAAVLSEVRAVYGGLFAVLGVYTLLAAANPANHRARLFLIGLMWLGICGGRLLGISIDGSPGLKGWASAALEFVIGIGLLVASRARPPLPEAYEPREAA